MELDDLLESNSINSKFDEINSRVIFLSEELEIMGYRNAEYNVRSILHGLGFDQRM
jgi:hypothetical protein